MKDGPVIGKSIPRLDSFQKVTGSAKYASDISLPGMLYGKILTSPFPHAKILGINTARATKIPGVVKVVTSRDAPAIRYGSYLKDQLVFAREKTYYAGQPVAAVAAVDEHTAEEALDLIDVQYQQLPAIFDPLEAMEPGAALIHEGIDSYVAVDSDHVKYRNVCSYRKFELGNVEKGFKEAERIYSHVFRTHCVSQSPIEPHASLAIVDADGLVTVWTGTQEAYHCKTRLSEALNLPLNRVRIVNAKVGGGFGSKYEAFLETIAVLLSQKTGKPVKIALSRAEEFTMLNPRHPAIVEIKTGVAKDGKLTSRHIRLIYDTGGFAYRGPGVMKWGLMHSAGPYVIPNLLAEGYAVYSNKISCGAFRGYGAAQALFAEESHMDMIAEDLGIDPIEFRLKNAFKREGGILPNGQRLYSVTVRETIEKASQQVDWANKRRQKSKNRGIGVAVTQIGTAVFASSALIKIYADGTVDLQVGTADIGTGTDTTFSQIAAEELGVPVENVNIVSADTSLAVYDFGTLSSRSLYAAGKAVKNAASDAKRQLLKKAAEILQTTIDDLEITSGRVHVKHSPERSSPFAEVAQACLSETGLSRGGAIIGYGTHLGTGLPGKETTLVEMLPNVIFATHIVELEVDRETGCVKIIKITSAHDVGKAINPNIVEGQIQGGVAQGIGYALTEETIFDQGRVLNPSFGDYKIPTAVDMPEIESIIIEDPYPTGPFGAKGVAEPPLLGVAPAVANAVYDALGIRIKELPITPEKILKALKEKRRNPE